MGGQKQQTPKPDEHVGTGHVMGPDETAEGHGISPKRASEAPEPEEHGQVNPVTGDDDTEGHRRHFH